MSTGVLLLAVWVTLVCLPQSTDCLPTLTAEQSRVRPQLAPGIGTSSSTVPIHFYTFPPKHLAGSEAPPAVL